MKHSLLLLIALAFFAVPVVARAAGVDLTWADCVGTGSERSNQNFTCTGTVNQNYRLIVQFKLNQDIPNFAAITAYLRLYNQVPGPLAPFWHYESGGCNRPAAGVSGISMFDNIQLLPNCAGSFADPWDGDGSGGFEGIAAYGADNPVPGQARLILIDARSTGTPLVAGVNYYAFHLVFNNRNRTVCAGCSQPVTVVAESLVLESDDGSPLVILKQADKFSKCVTINNAVGCALVGVEEQASSGFALHSNQPNPFDRITFIRFDLPRRSPVSVRIYDVRGRLVRVLADGKPFEPGSHQLMWDGTRTGPGVYFCELRAGAFRSVKRMVRLR